MSNNISLFVCLFSLFIQKWGVRGGSLELSSNNVIASAAFLQIMHHHLASFQCRTCYVSRIFEAVLLNSSNHFFWFSFIPVYLEIVFLPVATTNS